MGGAHVRTYAGHLDDVTRLAVLPESGGLVSGSHDSSIRIWHQHNAECRLVCHWMPFYEQPMFLVYTFLCLVSYILVATLL